MVRFVPGGGLPRQAPDPGPSVAGRAIIDIDRRRRRVGAFAGFRQSVRIEEANHHHHDEAEQQDGRRDDRAALQASARYRDRNSWTHRRSVRDVSSGNSARDPRSIGRGEDVLGQAVALALPMTFESETARGRRRSNRYIVGTKISVAKVANSRPPMTARPSGAFCSPPSPIPKRHRHHAENHRAGGHQHRAQARVAGGGRRAQRIVARRHALIGEGHHQNAVGGGQADAHERAHERRHAHRRLRQEQHPQHPARARRAPPSARSADRSSSGNS